MSESSSNAVDDTVEDVLVHVLAKYFKSKLEGWKDVEINIGVTGEAGSGISSFINAIRGLKKVDEAAAPTGVTETTSEPTLYPHPTNDKIKFWDLPGVGTSNYPAETYREKVRLGDYDTFLILTAGRFTENDLLLARMVMSMQKSFFLVRTKIDIDVWNESNEKQESNETFDEDAMLKNIKKDCMEKLQELASKRDDVFLISNRLTDEWEFARLTQAILDVLPLRQKECLTLSLTTRSKDILKRKVEVLRGRIFKIAAASGAGAVVPFPGLSIAVDLALLTEEVTFYKSQLGLPEENSYNFKKMTPETNEKVGKFCLTSGMQIANLVAAYGASSAVEEYTRFIPLVGAAIAGSISFTSTYHFLSCCLNDMEKTALEFLEELSGKTVRTICP